MLLQQIEQKLSNLLLQNVFTKVKAGTGAMKVCVIAGLLISCVGFFVQEGHAQSWPQSSLWTQSPLRLNPASAGNLYSLDASASVRRQWQGIEGAPSTTQFSVGAPVYIANAGVSFGFVRDEVGLQAVNLLRGALAYKVYSKNDLNVSVGGAITYRQASINGTGLRTAEGTYGNGIITHFDDLLPVTDLASSTYGFDAGLEIKWKETLFGVSVLDLNEPVSNWNGVNRKWSRTILTHASTLIPVAELIDIEASALLQVGPTTMQTLASISAWYNNNISAGGAFRGYDGNTLDAVSLLIGWRPSEKITLAYAYDFGLSTLVRSHQGSHEVVLRYVMNDPIGRGKLPPVIFNPRL